MRFPRRGKLEFFPSIPILSYIFRRVAARIAQIPPITSEWISPDIPASFDHVGLKLEIFTNFISIEIHQRFLWNLLENMIIRFFKEFFLRFSRNFYINSIENPPFYPYKAFQCLSALCIAQKSEFVRYVERVDIFSRFSHLLRR